MKKALALVLALVLALSMAVSAFGLVILDETTTAEEGREVITLIDWADDGWVLYTSQSTGLFSWFVGPYKYYVAIAAEGVVEFDEIKATSNGNLSAKFIDFDPEEMVILEADGSNYVWYQITKKGKAINDLGREDLDAYEWENAKGYFDYDTALDIVDLLEDNEDKKVTYYDIERVTPVYVLEITVAENYTTHYTTGTIEIEAKAGKKEYTGELTLINDVSIFEYEQVKWTAENDETIYVGEPGYSDYLTDKYGYDFDWNTVLGQYDEHDLRYLWGGAVISTTAFRAIEGQDITVGALGDFLTVAIDGVEAGQKGVNFHASLPYVVEKDGDSVLFVTAEYEDDADWPTIDIERTTDKAVAIGFGFKGDQVIKGEFTVTLDMGIDWYELRELFNIKVEEDDIITYYIVKDGKVIDSKTVDYMKDDISKDVKWSIKLADTTLGNYEIRLDVPAVEGESNPNTGAESVVGVVAALAVVSLATAAAVSLKK